eukprot:CAMPEP_0179485914 /NCGR_PEP_ID=MMETSP0799-20121207/62385_1 /TAXON_ID=46947 /ORGANISM="Geminigera cryophila, Strain CCMP2564" /LENGTH=116 /DNA_ID=CAMNT_0021300483 /DNA_START=152 /DNA_END=502 /DNA_ORIENTATION=+
MALCPFISIIVHRQAAQKWHDVMWYSIEMFVEILSIIASIWVLYHTDYSPQPEKKGLLAKASSYVREQSGGSYFAATPTAARDSQNESRSPGWRANLGSWGSRQSPERQSTSSQYV